jgi:hypothetical protein
VSTVIDLVGETTSNGQTSVKSPNISTGRFFSHQHTLNFPKTRPSLPQNVSVIQEEMSKSLLERKRLTVLVGEHTLKGEPPKIFHENFLALTHSELRKNVV